MYKDILFPVDVTDEDSWHGAVPTIIELAKAFGSRVHIMTAVPDFGMSIVSQYFPEDAEQKIVNDADATLHKFSKEHFPEGIEVQHIVSQGPVYQTIIDAADRVNADLIVMAAHRPELKDYLLGPNAAKVVRHSNRSVLVVRDQ